jgi:hypothetical protein
MTVVRRSFAHMTLEDAERLGAEIVAFCEGKHVDLELALGYTETRGAEAHTIERVPNGTLTLTLAINGGVLRTTLTNVGATSPVAAGVAPGQIDAFEPETSRIIQPGRPDPNDPARPRSMPRLRRRAR